MSLKKGEQKGLMMGITIAALVIIGGLWAFGIVDLTPEETLTYYPPAPTTPSTPGVVTPSEEICPLSSKSIVTVKQVDMFNLGTAISGGAAINMYRQPGSSWVDVASGSNIEKSGYTPLEFVSGIDSDDEAANEYGPYYPSWRMPCTYAEDFVILCSNDALVGNLTATKFDEHGTAGADQAVSANDELTLEFSFKCKSEETYGNLYCGGDPSIIDDVMTNLIVFQYYTTTIDKIELKSIVNRDTGETYTVTVASVPTGVQNQLITDNSTLTGFKAYRFPVLQDAETIRGKYFIDIDSTTECADQDLNITLWDSTWYLDNDDGLIKWGVEDEDYTNIGAASCDSLEPTFT